MGDENEVPLFFEFLFGEAARTAQRAESPRLMRWAEAFEAWLAERAEEQAEHDQASETHLAAAAAGEREDAVGDEAVAHPRFAYHTGDTIDKRSAVVLSFKELLHFWYNK